MTRDGTVASAIPTSQMTNKLVNVAIGARLISPSMNNREEGFHLTRRDILRLSTAGAIGLATNIAAPQFLLAEEQQASASRPSTARAVNRYAEVLKSWGDGMISHQVTAIQDPALHGALLCPACAMIHGRCGDAVYPLMHLAHVTGNDKYLRAALAVHNWTEQQVSRADGSWVNDVFLSSWKGITVFHTIALAEALHHHGSLLEAGTRKRWTDRVAHAAKFLDGFISIETGNINYPITASYAFALCGQVLGEPRYTERGRGLAHQSLDYFTPNGLIFGEGHPLDKPSPKGCRPIDLGYNVEESLPALALYSLLTNDQTVLDQTVKALKAHMEFMLPNGAWDNSWGTRNYKWSWWGSRTSDGCQPAYALLANHDPRFAEVALRNLEQMAACTHDGLLYGGPDYFAHGDQPCIHHTFTHAKALATVLDRGGAKVPERATLPRDEAYGVKSFSEIGTHLAAIGDWRATVTEYDWEYVEHVQSGGASGAGHASGGALSMLYHRQLGPILTASMTEYAIIELSNQQIFTDAPHMTLTPRIECRSDRPYTSLTDYDATLTKTTTPTEITFEAQGRLLSSAKKPMPEGDIRYRLIFKLTKNAVEISASTSSSAQPKAPVELIVPVIAKSKEVVERKGDAFIRIVKTGGVLNVKTDSGNVFEAIPEERTFNLVPGLECVPLIIRMKPGEETHLRFEMD